MEGIQAAGFLLDGRKELGLLLMSFFFRGAVSQGFSETALLVFTFSPQCFKSMAVTLLLNLAALAPSMLNLSFTSATRMVCLQRDLTIHLLCKKFLSDILILCLFYHLDSDNRIVKISLKQIM